MVEGFSPEELEERADKVHPAKLLATIQQHGKLVEIVDHYIW